VALAACPPVLSLYAFRRPLAASRQCHPNLIRTENVTRG